MAQRAHLPLDTRGASASPRDGAARSPLGTEIYGSLLSRILTSDLGPGDRLTIDALARELGVSQTPVREALHRLDAEGIVVRNHLAGYRVAPKMTRDQFEQMVEVRLLLEPAAARRAAERMSPEDIALLSTLEADMRELHEQRGSDGLTSYARFSQIDAQLHDAIALGSSNLYIRDSLARLHPHVHLFRLSSTSSITAEAIEEHQQIIDAIGAREPDAAAYAMRRHVEESARRFRAGFAADEEAAAT
ncbi:GntR family transcriptional regulator [Microbacterium sp. I2]|jgi:DNA-binding GntR family transcriptional regulator|uniref:GntR family transcriptional regulator n=1 Tax=Microbacterium sp. I2 TaxID=3391826 RepID=UPI003ED9D212